MVAAAAAIGAALKSAGPKKSGSASRAMRYKRKGTGWESFKCSCGHTIQLSPGFDAPTVPCGKCGRRIEIVPA